MSRWFLAAALLLTVAGRALGFALDPGEPVVLQPLSIAEGLSSDRITCLFQDRLGFLWIGTVDGLNRFDGHEVRVYRHDPDDPRSMAANWIAGIGEDAHGALWIHFGIGGLDRFDRDREVFRHYRHEPSDSTSLPTDIAQSSHQSADGRFWLGTTGAGWVEVVAVGGAAPDSAGNMEVRFRPGLDGAPIDGVPYDRARAANVTTWLESEGTWIGTGGGLFHRKGDTVRCVDAGPVATLSAGTGGRVWVGRPNGVIALFDPESASVIHRADARTLGSRRTPAFGPPDRGSSVVRIAEDPRGRAWFAVEAGDVFCFDPTIGKLVAIGLPQRVTDFRIDERGRLALATPSGLGIYDPVGEELVPAGGDPATVALLFVDRDDHLWLGTWGRGLLRRNEGATRFRHEPLPGVRCLAHTDDGALWIGTSHGLYRDVSTASDPAPVRGTAAERLEQIPGLADVPIAALAPAQAATDLGGLWLATDRALLYRDPEGSLRIVWRCEQPINTLLATSEGRLLIGTNDSLWRLDPDTDSPVRVPVAAPPRPDALFSPSVHALAEDEDGAVWVGTYVGGLSRLDPVTGRFRHYTVEPTNSQALHNLSVNCLYQDRSGVLWVGTYSGGLDRYDPAIDGFHHFTERNGLAGNQVLGIVEDDAGNLWVATNQGLSRLDPAREEIENFGWSDGLVVQPFEKGAGLRGAEGRVILGGRQGFVSFDPREIVARTDPPPLALTALRIDDARVPLAAHRGPRSDLVFRPHEDFFAFEFVGIEFARPERVRYSYRLVGFDDGWVESGPRRYAAYTNLDPGRYRFEARATLDGRSWSTPLAFDLEVLPPFYRTAWFLALIAGSLAVGLFGAHLLRVRAQVGRSLAEERIRVAERERVREQVARDYHDEMGHKLAKLGIFSELVQRSAARAAGPESPHLRDYAEKIDSTVQALVRDTRDFIWTLDPRRDSVYELALYMQEFGRRLFAETDVRFQVTGLDESLHQARLSPDWKRQLALIFKEALTNSLRHARAREVELHFGLVGDELEILASDDGRGFLAEGSPATGGGHGLVNMRRRAEAIGGRLLLETGAGSGTRLRFTARSG